MTLAVTAAAPPRDVAAVAGRRPPMVLTLSILAHLGLVVALLLPQHRQEPPQPREIPVEVVQMPAPPQPAPAAPNQPANGKPQERKAEERKAEIRKTEQRKTEQRKAEERKRDAAAKPTPPAQQGDVAQRMRQLLGSMPAIVLPGASDGGSEATSFKALVLSQVGKAKKEGRHNGVPGVATVGFSLDERGAVVRCEIMRKSVDPALDAEALAMIRRGAPYPVPPPGADRDFVVSLRFAALP